MDRLEKFVVQNRTEFDSAVPNLTVWANIDKTLERKTAKRLTLWRAVRVAAAVIVLLGTGALIGSYLTNSPADSASSLADIAPEYAELEQFYNSQIDQKIQQLASYRHDVYVQEDLRQLDEVFNELRAELKQAPKGTEEKIIQMMINNYQTKVNILERVLEKIQSTNPETFPEGESDSGKKTEDDEISI